jgi:hypothetical protein
MAVLVNSKQFRNPISGSFTGSFVGNLTGTSSYSTTASYIIGQSATASYAITSSLALSVSTSISTQNQQHNVLFVDTSGPGFIQVDGGLRYNPNQDLLTTTASYALTASFANNFTVANTLTAQNIVVQTISSSIEYASGSNIFGSLPSNTQSFTGSVLMSGSLSVGNAATFASSITATSNTLAEISSVVYNDAPPTAGSILVRHARGLSTAPTALQSGDRLGAFIFSGYNGSGFVNSTALIGYANENLTGIANGGYFGFETTAIGATSRTEKFRILGSGNIIIQNGGTFTDNGSRLQIIASGSQNALYVTGSSSFTGSVDISGSLSVIQGVVNQLTASYAVTASYWSGSIGLALTASYVQNAQTASYVLSSSYAATSSYADNFTVGNTLTAQRIVVQTISSSIEFASGSNRFGNDITNTHSFTGSVGITGSLTTYGTIYSKVSSSSAPFISIGVNAGLYPALTAYNSFGTPKSQWINSNGTMYFDYDGVSGSNLNFRRQLDQDSTTVAKFVGNGNLLLQNAGNYVDNGYKVQIQPSGSISGSLFVSGSSSFTGSVDITGSLTTNGNLSIISQNGRYVGFDSFAAGMTVDFRFGDVNNRLVNTFGSTTNLISYHGVQISNNSGGGVLGAALKVIGNNSSKPILELANATTLFGTLFNAGNFTLQNGGTFTDNGYKLQINSTGSLSGSLYVNGLSTFDGVISGSYSANNPSSSLILLSGSLQPSASLGGTSAIYVNTVLSASANSQTLVGLDIAPVFNNGAFTSVKNIAARFNNRVHIASNILTFGTGISADGQYGSGGIISYNQNFIIGGSGGITYFNLYNTTGNITLQNGGTFIDNGYRLQVNGSGSVSGSLFVSGSSVFSGSVDVSGSLTVAGNISPASNVIYDLGAGNLAYNIINVTKLMAPSGYNMEIQPGGLSSATVFRASRSGTEIGRFHATTGNLALQNGGTLTDNGYRLQINGSGSVSGSLFVSGSSVFNGTTTIVSASLNYQENLVVATGSFQTITSAATGSFRAAFFDYVAYSASVVRAGTVISTWSGSVTEYYENYTNDLGGNTSVVSLQTAISGSNIQLQAGISGSAWSVRSLVRLL